MPRDWDDYYRAQPDPEPPAFVVRAYAGQIPPGPVLDLAGGSGRNALFLARRGYRVTVVEQSGVALERVRAEAAPQNLPIHTIPADLESADPELPTGFAAILMSYFLHRPLLLRLPDLLNTGGLVLLESFTRAEGERAAARAAFTGRRARCSSPLRAHGEGWRTHGYRHRRAAGAASLEMLAWVYRPCLGSRTADAETSISGDRRMAEPRGPSGPSLEYRHRRGPSGPSLAYRAWAVWQKS